MESLVKFFINQDRLVYIINYRNIVDKNKDRRSKIVRFVLFGTMMLTVVTTGALFFA